MSASAVRLIPLSVVVVFYIMYSSTSSSDNSTRKVARQEKHPAVESPSFREGLGLEADHPRSELQSCTSNEMCIPGIIVTSPVNGGLTQFISSLEGGSFAKSITRPSRNIPFWGELVNSNMVNGSMRHHGLDYYFSLFKNSEGKYALDASEQYFTVSGTPEDISAHSPNAKVIIILADPAKRLLKHWMTFPFHLVAQKNRGTKVLDDILKDISTYKSCMLAKPKGPITDYKQLCLQKSFFYSSFYTRSIRQWMRAFGRSNVHIIYEDSLTQDAPTEETRAVFDNLQTFLGIKGDPLDLFARSSKSIEPVKYGTELLPDLYAIFSSETAVLEQVVGSPPPWKSLTLPTVTKRDVIFNTWWDAEAVIQQSISQPVSKLPSHPITRPVLEPNRSTTCSFKALKSRSLPSAFLMGAQKCATTTLSALLVMHPQLFTTVSKEIQWFSLGYGPSDSPWHQKHLEKRSLGIEWYQEQFKRTKDDPHSIGLDCSANYMSSLGTADEVAEVLPEGAKLIVTLCDPVQRAYSMYRMWSSQAKFARGHPIGNRFDLITSSNKSDPFYAAVLAEGEDYIRCIKNGPYNMVATASNTADYCEARSVLLHRGLYVRHLKRWIKRFGSSNVLILFKSEIATSPLSVIRKVEKFLCLDEAPETTFDPIKLHAHHNVDPFDCNDLRSRIKGTVECSDNHWNFAADGSRRGISPAAAEFLRGFYKCEEEELASLLEVDTLPWRR
eukprot:TRINITY_DN18799_c0_g1_i1.p1 TRINITY_DN18799_c0_g1~~TRINITY_DN18799_c0_g1_i1.p1  ORF type:complete len:739 (+),score=99.72 TRINITY_DN18799_c0_g1_i1:41-2218(+)